MPFSQPIRHRLLCVICALAASLLAAAVLAELTYARAEETGTAPGQAQGGDSVAGRVGKLEGQISDLQVMIGTLESLLRGKPGATLQHETPPTDSALAPRIEALEAQMGALAGELARLGKQLAAIEAKLAAAQGDPGDDATGSFRQGQGLAPSWESASAPAEPQASGAVPSPDAESKEQLAAASEDEAASLYRKAYGELLREDYKAAEAAFRQFLALHPQDEFAGNAQFWLGEAQFARGDYRGAADTYRESYKTYGKSERAPDALLKLAMSLSALGESQEACSTFGELEAKYPQAPQAVRDQARAARAKAGC